MAEPKFEARAPIDNILSVKYSSPSNASFAHIQEVPAPATESAKDRTAYLGELRKVTVKMQDRLNKELTARMEEDKVKEAEGQRPNGKEKTAVDEDKEEDNYGEEVVEED